jgi:hypothetical protein
VKVQHKNQENSWMNKEQSITGYFVAIHPLKSHIVPARPAMGVVSSLVI